jgi:hypothetical protein
MAETNTASDLGTGASLLFGLVALVAAVATAGTAYLSATEHSDQLQLFSGIALAVALVAAGIAIVVIHVFE